MLLQRVVGLVVADPKAEELGAARLAVVEPLGADLAARGKRQVALDTVGAAYGQMVFTVAAGPARAASGMADRPVDLAVIGIVDELSGPEPRGSRKTWKGDG